MKRALLLVPVLACGCASFGWRLEKESAYQAELRRVHDSAAEEAHAVEQGLFNTELSSRIFEADMLLRQVYCSAIREQMKTCPNIKSSLCEIPEPKHRPKGAK